MLISPKWQTMWMESQHSSKSIMNISLPSQSERVLEDLRSQCCSPNKAVQLEALKCWGIWIHSQKPVDWKLNTVCFAAVRPLITKRLQPLHKDVDICRTKLSLMWALLVKVQNLIHLEGPQYILEVFLQSCLTWLSATNDDGCEKEISCLIFKLLLGLFNKDENVSCIDKETFPPLTVDVLYSKKIFHRLAEKFLQVFFYWRKAQERTVILKLWKYFLEHCELSCEQIPVPVWHKIFKHAGQICSEKNEPVKERLAFLHGCATTLKSTLSSSKFIEFGSLLTTPCEALLKKLVELCCSAECKNCCGSEMFHNSKEICRVLSVKGVELGGFALCINVLDMLEEFWLRDLFWGVWCGLVYCYKTLLQDVDKSQFTKVQTKFYRKLRGVVVNFELDRKNLQEDCVREVEEHISILNISCVCGDHSSKNTKDFSTEMSPVVMNTDNHSYLPSEPPPIIHPPPGVISKEIVRLTPVPFTGKFSNIVLHKEPPRLTVNLNLGLIKNIIQIVGINFPKTLLSYTSKLHSPLPGDIIPLPVSRSLQFRPAIENMGERILIVRADTPSTVPECHSPKKISFVKEEKDDEVISTPLTRSRRRAEVEKEIESMRQTRRKRKSFEVIVKEILEKNKARKTEKNSRKKSPASQKGKRNKKKSPKPEKKKEVKPTETSDRKLRVSRKEEPKKEERKSRKTDGKLENYFKVLPKKTEKQVKREENKPQKKKKEKDKMRESCCKPKTEDGEKKGEIGWKQTSLKRMMTQKNQGRLRNRNKAAEEKNKVASCPLANMSPFKEVLHDHEYVKLDPLIFQERGFITQERKPERLEAEDEKVTKPEIEKESSEMKLSETESLEQSESEVVCSEKEEKCETICVEEVHETPLEVITEKTPEKTPEVLGETPIRRGVKRMRLQENHTANKRIKLDLEEQPEDKLPLEITEKENLEERQSPREKTGSSPMNTMSRALRMIALVPESTKGGQIQRESLPRVEVLKSKKGPNVDRSSRASKMLALISGKVVEIEDTSNVNVEDINSWGGLMTTPNSKTPVSSLKSPKSVKKRRSIRFDDAKNETVLYQTDTPPSQILEEKEKCRRIKLAEITVYLP